MALCGLHHWSFDEGIISIASDYRILVSPIVYQDQEQAEPILALADKSLHLPKEQPLRPAKRALKWHREIVFRDALPPQLV